MTRKCWICKQVYPLTEEYFYKNKSKPDGWGTECRTCHKIMTRLRENTRRAKFIDSLGNACANCGFVHEDHRFFDLDHIVPLKDHSAPRTLRDYDKDKLQVLCPNCHRIKTIIDMNWGKYEVKS